MKSRINQQIKEAIYGSKEISANHNPKIVEYNERLIILRHKIRALVTALKDRQKSMMKLDKTRLDVAKKISALALGTPLEISCGIFEKSDVSNDPSSNEICQSNDTDTYVDIHKSLKSRREVYYDHFTENVINYVEEWERIICVRVTKNIQEADDMRRDLDHYELKVKGLQVDLNKQKSKGYTIEPKASVRIKRNEEKLFQAREKYQYFVKELLRLLQEVTDRGWKDLHPLLLKLVQFDWSISNDEYKICSNLKIAADQLRDMAPIYGLKPETRINELSTKSAKELSITHNRKIESYKIKPTSLLSKQTLCLNKNKNDEICIENKSADNKKQRDLQNLDEHSSRSISTNISKDSLSMELCKFSHGYDDDCSIHSNSIVASAHLDNQEEHSCLTTFSSAQTAFVSNQTKHRVMKGAIHEIEESLESESDSLFSSVNADIDEISLNNISGGPEYDSYGTKNAIFTEKSKMTTNSNLFDNKTVLV